MTEKFIKCMYICATILFCALLVHIFWGFAWALNLAKIMAVGCGGILGAILITLQ